MHCSWVVGAFVTFQDWLGFCHNSTHQETITYPTLGKKEIIFQTALAWDIYTSQDGISTYKRHHPILTSSLFHTFIQQHDSTDGGLFPVKPPLSPWIPPTIITSAVCSSRDMIGPCGLVQSSVLMDHFVPPSRFLSEWGVGVRKLV